MPPRPIQHSNQFHNTRHTYIPEHAQRLMARNMERTMPSSMKKYAGAFVQQNVVEGNQGAFAAPASPVPHPAAVPNFQQQSHFQPEDNPAPAPQPQAQVVAPTAQPPAQPVHPAAAPEPYDFIMNAEQQPKRGLPFPKADSTLKRVIFAVGGLFVLLILFIIVKGMLSGGSDLPLFVSIAQDQQELIHLTSPTNSTGQQVVLSASSQDFAATTNASVSSSQSALLTYLAKNKYKVKPSLIGLKVSQQLDTQLTNATAAGTYDSTFQQIMKTQLTTYQNDLSATYQKTTGKNGRALLSNDYKQAKLLLTQLGSGQ